MLLLHLILLFTPKMLLLKSWKLLYIQDLPE
jgi:hypothetical protein